MPAAFTAVVLAASLAGAQTGTVVAGCPNDTGVTTWAIPVRVLTPTLRAVDSLQSGDFIVTSGGVDQPVCRFVHGRHPTSVGILLDVTGSMQSALSPSPQVLPRVYLGKLDDPAAIARVAIEQLLTTAGPQDEFFLEYVSNAPAMRCEFTRDAQTIRAGLDAKPKGKTALIDSLYLALTAMRKAHHADRALLVISDALENASIFGMKELRQAFSDSPVPIFLLIPGKLSTKDPAVFLRPDILAFINASGGYSMAARNSKEAAFAAAELASSIRSPYMLYFAGQGRASQLRDVKIAVRGAAPKTLVLYRSAIGYTP